MRRRLCWRIAVVLVVVAFFLKAAVVPFHAWAPDAYEAAAVPVTAYMAAIIKAGVVLAVVRLFNVARVTGPIVDLIALLPLLSIATEPLPEVPRMAAESPA